MTRIALPAASAVVLLTLAGCSASPAKNDVAAIRRQINQVTAKTTCRDYLGWSAPTRLDQAMKMVNGARDAFQESPLSPAGGTRLTKSLSAGCEVHPNRPVANEVLQLIRLKH